MRIVYRARWIAMDIQGCFFSPACRLKNIPKSSGSRRGSAAIFFKPALSATIKAFQCQGFRVGAAKCDDWESARVGFS